LFISNKSSFTAQAITITSAALALTACAGGADPAAAKTSAQTDMVVASKTPVSDKTNPSQNKKTTTSEPTPAPAPAPAPTSGKTLSVGPGKNYATPCAAFAAAANGDVIEIDGTGSYAGDACGIYRDNLTIRGVNGRPKIDANGMNAMGKGIWVAIGNGITVDNVEMLGAKVPNQNGAAIRIEGTGFTLRRSFLHDNENGILTGENTASDIVIENSEFSRNGYGTGYTHNLYIGHVRSLVFRNNYSHDAHVGHNLKSRAEINTIAYNRFSSSGLGQPSYEIDLPNAGVAYVIGNVIQQPSSNQNENLLAFGEEGASNAKQELYVVNNTFLNDSASGGTFVLVGSGVTTPVLLQNNIFAGAGNITNQATAASISNYQSAAPAFTDRTNFDLRPAPGSPMVNAGSMPSTTSSGMSLVPLMQYRHVAGSDTRVSIGKIDIGAYETTTP
jgi:hypothetical protein